MIMNEVTLQMFVYTLIGLHLFSHELKQKKIFEPNFIFLTMIEKSMN